MAKTRISEFSSNPANNTDIDGINVAEGMAPGLVNNAFRELMAQLKDFQAGTAGDNFTVGGNLAVTGTSTLTGNVGITGTLTSGAITMSGRAVDAFPSGTKMLFQQTTAPTGWTKDTTHDNKALRVVTGAAGSGGSVNFTTAFSSQNVGATTLTTAQIPVHSHTFSGSGTTGNAGGHSHTINDPGHFHSNGRTSLGSADGNNPNLSSVASNTGTAVTGISINAVGNHAHSVSVSGSTGDAGSGNSHTHTLDLAVQYVDLIICTKS
jgi:hypothetical protein